GVFTHAPPPALVGVWAPLKRLPGARAQLLFVAIKAAVLAWLIRIWSRLVQTRVDEPVWILFLIFAFSSTIFVDFVSGSVTTFEQLFVWLGVAALLGRRPWAFVAAIVMASLFRLAPIGLLAVCLAVPGERRYRYVAGGAAAFAIVFLLTYVASPQLTLEFVRTIPRNFGERGRLNPALGALVLDASDLVVARLHVAVPQALQGAIYLGAAGAIVATTIAIARRAIRAAQASRTEALVYLVMLAYAIAMPRFRSYHYMLLIVPTYFVVTRSARL